VWIARPRAANAPAAFQILLCSENPDSAKCPVELLSKLAWPEGTACCALTVISSVFAGHVPAWLEEQARSPDVEEMVRHWVREHEEAVQNSFTRMRKSLKDFPGAFSRARPLVAEGEAAEQILAEIDRQHADLVVIGAKHGHSTAATIFGSTSEAVLNHAGCSVLVVPHPEIC
jgi:nucleotide-binding universal stress UspA family protein